MLWIAAATLRTPASPGLTGSRKNKKVTMNIRKTLKAETRKTFSMPSPKGFLTSHATTGPSVPPTFTSV